MFKSLPDIRLKTGETVSVAVIRGPDLEWADRVEPMLAHKGDPWNWQIGGFLRRDHGLAVRFYLLHRAGRPFANIMVAESAGIALLAHVWTERADRGAGASSILMELALADFRQQNTRAMILGTEPGSDAFHYYGRRGFVPVTTGSGYMILTRDSMPAFFTDWFVGEPMQCEPLGWPHWPAAAPLCLGDFPERVRLAATGLVGRGSSEGALLPILRRQERVLAAGGRPCAVTLAGAGGRVWGLASLLSDPMWPEQDVLDVFCHPQAWSRAPGMLAALARPAGRTCVAYVDAGSDAKGALLASTGFTRLAELPGWLPGRTDVSVWRRTI